ncbi:hypothetical protein H6788_00725 [Candidatus Nomurabacteria bacterium]|nr:hypothetical protein [Candidatus Nomurabacteria bacterium]MCB9819395.1 hypothetical protein [Candidatus Nomurabacteria bacterium]
MNDVVRLLLQIEKLPEASFKPGASPSSRTKELSLLDTLLPVLTMSDVPAVARKCIRKPESLSMHYQLRNNGHHNVFITYNRNTQEVSMTVNGQTISPSPSSTDDLMLILKQLLEGKGP